MSSSLLVIVACWFQLSQVRVLVESWPDSLFLLMLFYCSYPPPPHTHLLWLHFFHITRVLSLCSSHCTVQLVLGRSRPNSRDVCWAWSSSSPLASRQMAPENEATTVKPAGKWSVECSCSSGCLHRQVETERHQRSGRKKAASWRDSTRLRNGRGEIKSEMQRRQKCCKELLRCVSNLKFAYYNNIMEYTLTYSIYSMLSARYNTNLVTMFIIYLTMCLPKQ